MYVQEEETIDTSDIIDEEWQKFEARHFAPKRRSWGWMQIAAAFIGLLMLSGIAYAAIHIVRSVGGNQQSPTQETRITNPQPQATSQLKEETTDSIPPTRIFENMPLDEMVNELAIYYNKVADIQNPKAHEVRLYYKWERKDELESVVNDLNHFDHVNLILEEDKLIVKP